MYGVPLGRGETVEALEARPPVVVYLAGPVTAATEEATRDNLGRFWWMDRRLRALGYVVLGTHGLPGGLGEDFYMRVAMEMVHRADVVGVLPGWVESQGANAEVALAEKLGTPWVLAEGLTTTEPASAADVQALVDTIRGSEGVAA